jgi:predicted CoA-binding protein
MSNMPDSVVAFLNGRRFAVAGVSRQAGQSANAIYRRLKTSGYEVYPVNPRAAEIEGVRCFPDISAVPGRLDGVVVATPPAVAVEVVQQCANRRVPCVWFHRSFGTGSVSEEAVRACQARGMTAIVGGCPLMFCEPVDIGHRCMRWWLQRQGRVPS